MIYANKFEIPSERISYLDMIMPNPCNHPAYTAKNTSQPSNTHPTIILLREALQKKNHGDSEFGPTPLNPPSPTSDREKKCRDSCVQI